MTTPLNLWIFFFITVAVCVVGCADPEEDVQGQIHALACEAPLLNDDFLLETLDQAWSPRAGTEGSHELTSSGSAADRRGYLALRDGEQHADIAPSDRSAYGVTRPLSTGDVALRAMLIAAPADRLHFSGILVEQDQDNLVAVGVRGVDDIVQAEMWSFIDGEFRVGGTGELTTPTQVLLELSRQGDRWTATVNGTEVGHGEVALEGDLVVGPFVGSPTGQVAEVMVEWIEGCR